MAAAPKVTDKGITRFIQDDRKYVVVTIYSSEVYNKKYANINPEILKTPDFKNYEESLMYWHSIEIV